MRPFPSRCLLFAATLSIAAATLAGCTSGSASSPGAPPPSATGSTGTSTSVDPAAVKAGAVLEASGGYTGHLMGTFRCTKTADTTIVTLTAGATSMVIRAVGGQVVESAYLSVGQDFGGPITPPGQGGTITAKGTSATLTNVHVPSRTGGAPMILNGTITCH